MSNLFTLVFFCVALVTAINQVLASEVCNQDGNLCSYVVSCASDNSLLLALVVKSTQVAVDEEAFKLRHPNTVTSVEDFYQELLKYHDILQGFDSSMKTYMATPDSTTGSGVTEVANIAGNYTKKIARSLSCMKQAINYISGTASVTTPSVIPTTTQSSILKKLGEIYAETYYVTDKMNTLLQTWQQKCRSCPSTRRRRAIKGN